GLLSGERVVHARGRQQQRQKRKSQRPNVHAPDLGGYLLLLKCRRSVAAAVPQIVCNFLRRANKRAIPWLFKRLRPRGRPGSRYFTPNRSARRYFSSTPIRSLNEPNTIN